MHTMCSYIYFMVSVDEARAKQGRNEVIVTSLVRTIHDEKQVILIEGLSFKPPFYSTLLRIKLLPLLGRVYDTFHGWNQKLKLPPDHESILVVHGLGWLTVRDKLKNQPKQPLAIVAIDPRSFGCGLGEHLVAPEGIPTYSFYQKSWFWVSGYPINGATNVRLKGYGHSSILRAREISDLIKRLL